MSDDEFAAAFWYYLPVTKNRLGSLGIAAESIERVAPNGSNSFRQRRNAAADRSAGDIQRQLLSEPWRHLKISLLLAWRGVFLARSVSGPSPSDRDLGYSRARGTPCGLRISGNSCCAALGRSVQRCALHHSPSGRVPESPLCTRLVLAGAETVRCRDHRLPALYCHGVYAVGHPFHSSVCGSRNAVEVGHRHAPRVPCGIPGAWATGLTAMAARSGSDQNCRR